MVIGASAAVALLMGDDEADGVMSAFNDPVRLIGAPTLVEAAAIVRARKGEQGEIALDALLQRLGVRIVPFTSEAAQLARSGVARFGLGLGECLAYGLAMDTGEALLYTGSTLGRTDATAARL